ncbi:VCBS domain-containing protein, partial [Aurantimonas sp. 22II-16-19i]|uniref:VCBS domain-containing protein n=1 Tax=Aurantimonas sp. 22II-16-19i TaxID=1317114 RepID=UPI0009F7E66D
EGQALTYEIDTAGTVGTVTNNLDGTFTYDATGEFDSLAAGEFATDSFTYTVSDGEGGTDTETVTVTVTGTNDAPVFNFVQSFETGTDGVFDRTDYGTVIDVTSGTGGIVSPDGTAHAVVTETPSANGTDGSGPFTRFGGYTSEFVDGMTTEVMVYLDTTWALGEGFDYSVAANGSDGLHQRDFIFHVTQDSDGEGLLVGADNGSSFEPRENLENGPNAEITASGWYTLQHVFNEDDGVLAVTMNVLDATGKVVFTQTLSNPADTIGAGGEVGGVRYGWFTDVSVTGGLHVDRLELGTRDGAVTEIVDGAAGENDTALTATGVIAFADPDATDTHTATFEPGDTGYLGTFTLAGTDGIADDSTGEGDGEGHVRWSFSVDDAAVDFLGAGETLTQTYTITLDDGIATTTETVTITITGTNDGPVLVGENVTEALTEDANVDAGALVATDTIAFTDVDLTDDHTVTVGTGSNQVAAPVISYSAGVDSESASALALTTALQTALTAAIAGHAGTGEGGDITTSFAVDNALTQFLAVGETVTAVYSVALADEAGISAGTRTVSVTITGTNDTPVIATGPVTAGVAEDVATVTDDPTTGAVEEGAYLTQTGTLAFSDVDLTDTHMASASFTSSTTTSDAVAPGTQFGRLVATVATATANGTGGEVTWTYAVENAAVQLLAEGETVTETYTVTVDDGNGGTTTQTVAVTITGTNDDPKIAAGPVTADVTEDGTTVADDPTTVDDENGAYLTQSGTLAFSDVDLTDTHAASASFTASTTTSDAVADGTQFGTLVATVSTATANGTGGEVTWTYAVDNAAVQLLAEGETVTETYTVTVDDGNGGTATQTVAVTITGSNDAPTVTTVDDAETLAETDGPLTATGSFTVADVDVTDEVTALVTGVVATGSGVAIELDGSVNGIVASDLLAMLSLSAGPVVDGSSTSGTLTWTFDSAAATVASAAQEAFDFLDPGDQLTLTYDVAVGDGTTSVTETVTITITGTNDRPVIAADGETIDADGNVVAENQGIATGDLAASVTETNGIEDGDTGTGAVLSDGGTLVFADADADQTPTISVDTDAADIGVTYRQPDGAGGFTDVAPASGSDLDIAIAALVAGASISLNGGGASLVADDNSGTVGWAFSVDADLASFLAEGEELVLAYTVTVDDGGNVVTAANGDEVSTSTRTLTVTLTGTNDAPVVDVDASQLAGSLDEIAEDSADPVEGSALSTGGTIAFTDADLSDTPTVAVDNTSVAIAYTPAGASEAAETLNSSGDNTGATAFQQALLALAVAIDLGDASDANASAMPGTNDGSVAWTYAISDGALGFLGAGESVTLTYPVTVTDEADGEDTTRSITVTITGTNDAPVITGTDVTASLAEDTAVTSGDLTASDTIAFTDVDLTDDHTVTVGNGSNGVAAPVISYSAGVDSESALAEALESALATALQAAIAGHDGSSADGAIATSFALDNDLVQFLDQGESVTATYTVEFTDATGVSAGTRTVTITVDGANEIVVGSGNDDFISLGMDGRSQANYNLGEEIDGQAGDDVIYGGGGDDDISGGANDDVIYGGSGNDDIDFEGTGDAAADTGANTPSSAGRDLIFAGSGDDRIFAGEGDDEIDGGSGSDTVVFSGNRADYTISRDGTDIIVSGVDGTDVISNVETLSFADEEAVSTDNLFAPGFTQGPLAASVAENQSLAVGQYLAVDGDGTAVTYALSGDDAARFAISADGFLTFVGADLEGEDSVSGDDVYDVTVEASSGGETVTRDVAVTVTNVNDAPTAVDGTASGTEDGGAVTIDVASLVGDVETADGDLVVTASVDPQEGSVTVSGTQISFTPAANFNGTADIAYEVRDAGGLVASAVIAVAIAAENDGPAASVATL